MTSIIAISSATRTGSGRFAMGEPKESRRTFLVMRARIDIDTTTEGLRQVSVL